MDGRHEHNKYSRDTEGESGGELSAFRLRRKGSSCHTNWYRRMPLPSVRRSNGLSTPVRHTTGSKLSPMTALLPVVSNSTPQAASTITTLRLPFLLQQETGFATECTVFLVASPGRHPATHQPGTYLGAAVQSRGLAICGRLRRRLKGAATGHLCCELVHGGDRAISLHRTAGGGGGQGRSA